MEGNRGFFGLPAELMSALGTVLGLALLGKLDYNQQNSLAQQQGDRLTALERELEKLKRQVAAHCSTEPTVAADSGGEEKTT